MDEIVYVQLFDDGVPVWRPVPATSVRDAEFILRGEDEYDPEMEQWEFLPGTRVRVEVQDKSHGGGSRKCLVAVEALEGDSFLGEFGIAGSEVVSIDYTQDRLLLSLRSNGYGRPQGSIFLITFENPRAVQNKTKVNQEIYGLRQTISVGTPRQFSLMEGPSSSCLALSADHVTVEKFPSGWWRSFPTDNGELLEITRSGKDLIASIEGWEYWRSPVTTTKLCFRQASVLVESRPSNRKLSSLIETKEADGRRRYVFLAADREECLELLSKDFVEMFA
jgi:hypothetical protein